MELDKVRALGAAGKFDVCASSSSTRKVSGNEYIGHPASSGICHSFTENGRCISLFKTLMTNGCTYDCKYCQNSSHCTKKVYTYQPEELANVFMNLFLGNYVEGLFLSSGIPNDPDKMTEKMLEAVRILREKHKFQGYIHFKILPGTNNDLIKQAALLADRLSVNLEAPNKSRMSMISSVKEYSTDILRRQSWIKRTKLPAGQTTQLVIGGSDESDMEILRMADWQYKNLGLKRVYYSAFHPVEGTPLSKKERIPLEREHQLYSVDFMIRKYDIKIKEFKDIMIDENLPKGDPKIHLARNYFSERIDVNSATREELLRVPGIGPRSVDRIISVRENTIVGKKELEYIGVVMKRAEPFLSIEGKTQTTLGAFV